MEAIVLLTISCIIQFYPIVSDTSLGAVCKKEWSVVPPHTAPLLSFSKADNNSDRQDHKWLYCGYCNIQCIYAAGLVKHCKLDRHKFAVFADSGRDIFWQFEPPPTKKHDISAAVYG